MLLNNYFEKRERPINKTTEGLQSANEKNVAFKRRYQTDLHEILVHHNR